MTIRGRVWIVTVITLLCMSWSYVGIAWCLIHYETMQLAALRSIIVVLPIILFSHLLWRKCSVLHAIDWIWLLGLALQLSSITFLLHYASVDLTPTVIGFLCALPPIFTLLISRFFYHADISRLQYIGVIIGFVSGCGLLWLHWNEMHVGLALLFGLMAAMLQATLLVGQKKLQSRHHYLLVCPMVLLITSLLWLPLLPEVVKPLLTAPAVLNWVLLSISVVTLGFGYISFGYILEHGSALRVSSFYCTLPILTGILAWFFLGIKTTAMEWVFGAIMMLGVVVVQSCSRDLSTPVRLVNAEKND